MMKYALRELKKAGYNEAGLWVLDENRSAAAFYEKQGFVHSGAVKKENLGKILTESIYIKKI